MIICHPYLCSKGGGERIVVKTAEYIDSPVYVVDYKPENLWEEYRDLDVHVLKSFKPYFFGYRWTFKNLKLKTDVINAQGHPSQWIRIKNKPVIWYCHFPPYIKSTKPIPPGLRYIEKRIINKIEFVFCNSEFIKEKLKRYYNKDAEVLNPRCDVEKYKPGKFKDYFFYPSRIHPRKRFEIAIQAMKIVRKKYPEFKLIIAGFPTDDNYLEKLRDMLGDSGKIMLNVDDKKLIELFTNCYAVLYTPWIEDFGIVPTEGLASGKPVIAINEGGPREIVVDGKTGFLINSAEEMAKRMIELIKDRKLTRKMGKAARKRAEKKYGWDSFLRRFEEVYEEIRDGKKVKPIEESSQK